MRIVNIITELFTKVKDGDGNAITSTDVGGGHRGLDINYVGDLFSLSDLLTTYPLSIDMGSKVIVNTSDITLSIADASTSLKGAVQLSNETTGTSETKAATEKAVSDSHQRIFDIEHEPTGFEDRITSSISFNDATREFTITPTDTTFNVWTAGTLYQKETSSVIIDDTIGLWYIYFGTDGVLTASQTEWSFISGSAFVATVYWDGIIGALAEERHSVVMDGATHGHLHHNFGITYFSGLDGTFLDSTFTISEGELYDEDLLIEISEETYCNVIYRNSGAYKFSASQTKYYIEDTNILQYDNSSTLTDVDDQKYMAMWIFGSNDVNTPIYALVGQRQDDTLKEAREGNIYSDIDLLTLPSPEMKLLYRVILQRNGTDEIFIESQDLRNIKDPVPEIRIQLSDVDTNNVSILKHGFIPKLPDDASQLFNGIGEWEIPKDGTFKIQNTADPTKTGVFDLSNISTGETRTIYFPDKDIDLSKILTDPTNIVTVGPTGCEFTSIQSAINSITTATDTNRYCILIYPGIYVENIDFTGKPYIYLRSIGGPGVTIVYSLSGTTLTLDGDADFSVTGLLFNSVGGKILNVPTTTAGLKFNIFNECYFIGEYTNTYQTMIELNSGNNVFTTCLYRYTVTGTGGGTHKIFSVDDACHVKLSGAIAHMIIPSGCQSDDVVFYEETGDNVVALVTNGGEVTINRSGIVTGETSMFSVNGSSQEKYLTANIYEINNGGSGGIAQIIKSAGNGSTVHMSANTLRVLNFGSNYLANVGATDTLNTFFDSVNCADGSIGTGTKLTINGRTNGDFLVERDILLSRNLEIGGTLGFTLGTTINEISTDGTLAGDSDDAVPTEKAVLTAMNTAKALYILKDGSEDFTSAVGGVTPIANTDFTTKAFVEALITGAGSNDVGPFIDKDLTTSPTAVEGNKYIVAGTGGEWSTATINDIAECTDDSPETWVFTTPDAGNHGWVNDEGIDYTFTGSAWAPTGSTISHTTLQDIGSNSHTTIDAHLGSTSNPHTVTKTQVSLGNVTNDAQLKRSANDFNNGISEKTNFNSDDRFLIEDSDDSFAKKYIKSSNIPDEKVSISSTDTVQDFLENKLIGTTDKITVTKIGTGGDEDLQIDIGTDVTGAITHKTSNGSDHSYIDQDVTSGSDPTLNPVLETSIADLSASGIKMSGTVDTNSVGVGCALVMSADGHFDEADANAAVDGAGVPCMGLALETLTGTKTILLQGIIRNDAWNWTVGGKAGAIYLSTSAGGLTQTRPNVAGEYVQYLGVALSADTMYFNPGAVLKING